MPARIHAAQTIELNLPSACPLVYELATDSLAPVGAHGTWGAVAARRGRFLMGDALVAEAQAAMGQQCLQNIAVSTVGAATAHTAPARSPTASHEASCAGELRQPAGKKVPFSYRCTEK